MAWNPDYLVCSGNGWVLWRLRPGDRFGPYMLVGCPDLIKDRLGMNAASALLWLWAHAELPLEDCRHLVYEAEEYFACGGDECQWSLSPAGAS